MLKPLDLVLNWTTKTTAHKCLRNVQVVCLLCGSILSSCLFPRVLSLVCPSSSVVVTCVHMRRSRDVPAAAAASAAAVATFAVPTVLPALGSEVLSHVEEAGVTFLAARRQRS